MAKETTVLIKDDFDLAQDAAETIPFSFEGRDYTIDLSTANAKEFREIMSQYTGVGTRVPKRGRPRKPAKTAVKV